VENDHPDLAWTHFNKQDTYKQLEFDFDTSADDIPEKWTHFSESDSSFQKVEKTSEYE